MSSYLSPQLKYMIFHLFTCKEESISQSRINCMRMLRMSPFSLKIGGKTKHARFTRAQWSCCPSQNKKNKNKKIKRNLKKQQFLAAILLWNSKSPEHFNLSFEKPFVRSHRMVLPGGINWLWTLQRYWLTTLCFPSTNYGYMGNNFS